MGSTGLSNSRITICAALVSFLVIPGGCGDGREHEVVATDELPMSIDELASIAPRWCQDHDNIIPDFEGCDDRCVTCSSYKIRIGYPQYSRDLIVVKRPRRGSKWSLFYYGTMKRSLPVTVSEDTYFKAKTCNGRCGDWGCEELLEDRCSAGR